MLKESLALSANMISSPESSSGVCSFRVSCKGTKFPGMFLECEIAGSTFTPQKFEASDDKLIGIHTHLLPNGNCEIVFRLVEGDKKRAEVRQFFSLNVRGGLYESVRNAQIRNGTKLFFEGGCDSSMYPYEDQDSIRPWFERKDAYKYLNTQLNENKISDTEHSHLSNFVENGFIEIEGLIDDSLIDLVNDEIDDAIVSGYNGYEKFSSQRLERLHEHYPNIRKLWLDKSHRRVVDLIFGVSARPTQTLTFVCGSQQPAHSDLVYLTPFPAGYMCGTWIALQNVVEGSGELVVYPGSHREKRIYLRDTGCQKVGSDANEFNKIIYSSWAEIAAKYKPTIYRPKKGSVLIWHENLLHGGSTRINQNLERRSIVIHSFADGACVYYDATGSVGHVAPLSLINE